MIPGRILDATRTLGAPVDWDEARHGPCSGLPVRIERHGAMVHLTSAWQPTPDEIDAISRGAAVHLTIVRIEHPPVIMGVGPVPE